MIAIVGGGIAGISAAEALREGGYEGELKVFCGERSRPYERPALSKSFLTDPGGDGPPPILSAQAIGDLGIDLELGSEVVALDVERRRLRTASGREFSFERLLLATGAEPRRLHIPGGDLKGVHYLREIADARALRSSLRPAGDVAVIGGGVIGLEIAAAARVLGCEVTVVETETRVLGRIGPPGFGELMGRVHREKGVSLRTAVGAVSLEGSNGGVRGVNLETGELIPAQTVIVGVGATPRTALAREAGLRVDEGILVDGFFRTSDARVFAAGDAAQVHHAGLGRHIRVEQWGPAEEQGRRAGESMLGVAAPYRGTPWMWSDQFDFHAQAAGYGFSGTEVVRRGDLSERTGVVFFGTRGGKLVAACGVSAGTGVAKTVRLARRLIGLGASVSPEELVAPVSELHRWMARSGRQSTE